ncbi:MAG TPA: hypothetical protein VLA80_05460 [Actinomycetota bacterium]|nr:hypothetical protein [Actinomycetota bacterium]
MRARRLTVMVAALAVACSLQLAAGSAALAKEGVNARLLTRFGRTPHPASSSPLPGHWPGPTSTAAANRWPNQNPVR